MFGDGIHVFFFSFFRQGLASHFWQYRGGVSSGHPRHHPLEMLRYLLYVLWGVFLKPFRSLYWVLLMGHGTQSSAKSPCGFGGSLSAVCFPPLSLSDCCHALRKCRCFLGNSFPFPWMTSAFSDDGWAFGKLGGVPLPLVTCLLAWSWQVQPGRPQVIALGSPTLGHLLVISFADTRVPTCSPLLLKYRGSVLRRALRTELTREFLRFGVASTSNLSDRPDVAVGGWREAAPVPSSHNSCSIGSSVFCALVVTMQTFCLWEFEFLCVLSALIIFILIRNLVFVVIVAGVVACKLLY